MPSWRRPSGTPSTRWWQSTSRGWWWPRWPRRASAWPTTRPRRWRPPGTRPSCGTALAAAGTVRQPAFAVVAAGADVGAAAARDRVSLRRQGAVAVGQPRGASGPTTAAGGGRAAERIRAIAARSRRDPDGAAAGRALHRRAPRWPSRALLRGGAPARCWRCSTSPTRSTGPTSRRPSTSRPSRLPERGPDGSGRGGGRRRGASVCSRARSTPSCGSTPGRPWMLEVAARSIGGLCSRSLRFGTGMSLEELILRHALGAARSTPAAGAGGLRGDDAARFPPRGHAGARSRGQEAALAVAGHRGPRDCRSPAAGPSGRCPRATATSASSSPGATRPTRSRPPCGPPTRCLEVVIDAVG